MESLVSRKRRDCACFARRRGKMIRIGSWREGRRERERERERGKSDRSFEKIGGEKRKHEVGRGFFKN